MSNSAAPAAAPACTIVVEGHPMSVNQRRRSHHMAVARDTRVFRDAVAIRSKAAYHGPPLERARVHATLVRTGGQRYDPDNAVGVLKPILDGLCVRAGGTVLVDDRDVALVVTQETGPARGVVVRVWPAEVHTPVRTGAAVADNRADASEGVTR